MNLVSVILANRALTCMKLTRSLIEEVLTSVVGIKLTSLWDMRPFLTNCVNPLRHLREVFIISYFEPKIN